MSGSLGDRPRVNLDAARRAAEQLVRLEQRRSEGQQSRPMRAALHAATQVFDHENPAYLEALLRLKRFPVTIDEFIESREFYAEQEEIWPALREDLRRVNPDVLTGAGHVDEVIFGGATGCHAAGTMILMFDGTTKRVEDVVVGDRLMGPDSQPRTVLALARGREEMFRITPKSGGEPFVVNKSHILSLKRTRRTNTKPDSKAGTIENMTVAHYLGETPFFRHLRKLWRTGVEFTSQSAAPLIPPYILGAWLGDGTSEHAHLTNADSEVIGEWRAFAARWGCQVREIDQEGNASNVYRITRGNGQWNPVLALLRGLGVLENKHIPHRYLTASRPERLELLAGLVDTDGSLSCGGYEITQKRERLARDILFLARSLGFRASITEKPVNGTTYWRVFISGDTHLVPARIPRKRLESSNHNRDPLLSGFDVESVGEGDYFGFALDGDHLYLTADFTVHHNTGKTTTARASACYMLYYIQCFDNPQLLFGLSRATPIVFILTSVSQAVTKRVVYKPLRQNFLSMPFVKRYIPHDHKIESALKLPYNVEVVPVLAQINSLVGQAVIGGVVDEANFMAVIEKSSKIVGTDGTGGHFDQAEVVYTNMVRRRKSRFTSRGPSPGAIMAISSTAYKGDFIDRRIEEIETRQPARSIVVTHKQYEVKPEFSGRHHETFPVLIGTEDYPTRVLSEDDQEGLTYPEGARVEHVPMAYKTDFDRDPEGSARDVIGVSSAAITPFILQRNKIGDAFVKFRETGFKSITPFPLWHLNRKAMPPWVRQFIKDPKAPRYVHVDLAISGDRCGVAMARVLGFENRRRETEDGLGVVESVPLVALDFAIGIQPSAVQQLDIAELRRWLMALMVDHKVNLVSVTYDGFQSKESIQAWRKAGVFSKEFSVDRTTEPYEYLRRTLYEDRLMMPHSELLHQELMRLEWDKRKGKVDHPPRGSKDVADAVAAAVFQAANNRGARLLTGTYDDAGDPASRPDDYSKRQPIIRSNIRRR